MPQHQTDEYLVSEAHGTTAPDLDKSLWDLLSSTATTYPDREAVVSRWQKGMSNDGCLRWTYSELLGKTKMLASHIILNGITPSSQPSSRLTLAAITWNSAEWALLFWTSLYMGFTFVPLDPRNPNDLPEMLEAVQPDIVVVEDEELAQLVDDLDIKPFLRFTCQGSTESWVNINYNMTTNSLLAPLGRQQCHDPALLVFTSGTTGTAKGCPHTHANLVSQTYNFDANVDTTFVDRWMIHTPVCHIFAVNNALRAWRCGGAAIFPAKTFSVDSTIQALVGEQCTVMAGTPTLVKALHASPNFPSPDKLNLSVVTIAATSITMDDLRLCREGLGARDAIQAYGMSEGAPIISWSRQDPALRDGYHSGAGRVLPGCRIRVCHPGTQQVLSRGEVGELHIGGISVISEYLKGEEEESSSFYTDGDSGEQWLVTHDQARMDKEGIVYILGRYKDLIIRGGENIQPATIEAAVSKGIPGVQVQVVGVPHRLAGQVPVAVVSLPEGVSKADVCARARDLGLKYALNAVYTLEELGMSQMPVTSLNKPKKGVLQQAIAQLRRRNVWMGEGQPKLQVQQTQVVEAQSELGVQRGVFESHSEYEAHSEVLESHSQILESLLNAWERVIGTRPRVHDKIFYFANSITTMEYCYVVAKYDIQLHLSDFDNFSTVAKHAEIVAARASKSSAVTTRSPRSVIVSTPPTSVSSDTQEYSRNHIEEADAESTAQEDSIPIRHSFHRMIHGERPQSFNVRLVLRITSNPENLKPALQKLYMTRPLFQSTVTDSYHHVLKNPSAPIFERVESPCGPPELHALFQATPGSLDCQLMFRADILHCHGETYLVATFNHAVVDAISLWSWHRDLDLLLDQPDAVLPRPSNLYPLFAQMHQHNASCAAAQKSVQYHVRTLHGISRCTESIFPALDLGLICPGTPRAARVVRLLDLPALRELYGIKPDVFARCALVLFNVLETKTRHALFVSWESARSWPFVPPLLQKHLPSPMDIDGPTVEWILNMYNVQVDETVSQFMRRVDADVLDMQQNHVHAPLEGVLAQLEQSDRKTVEQVAKRQSFVWDVSLGLAGRQGLFRNVQLVNRFDWADFTLAWNMFMVDWDSLYFVASSHDSALEGYCDRLAGVMRLLANRQNWDKPISQVFSIL